MLNQIASALCAGMGSAVRKATCPSKAMNFMLAAIMLAWAGISHAQCDLQAGQLITNCDFDTDTSGWIAERGTLSHSLIIGSNDPGALGCTGEAFGAWTWCQVRQCIAISPSTTYGAGFDVVLTDAPPVPGYYPPRAQVRYQESSDGTCTSLFGLQMEASGSGLSTSNSFQQSTGSLTTTASANSILLEMRVVNQGGNGPNDVFTVHYDDAFFGIGLVPVELQFISIE